MGLEDAGAGAAAKTSGPNTKDHMGMKSGPLGKCWKNEGEDCENVDFQCS